MILLKPNTQILIYHQPVDMRKSIDGLSMLVHQTLHCDPQAQTLYLFRNKSGDKIKGLLFDSNGFFLLYKRLEQGRFKFPPQMQKDIYEIDSDLFKWLCKGFDFWALKQAPELKITRYY